MKQFLLDLISDGKGNVSSARFLNLLVGVCACLISWKLVLFKEYSEGYFTALLAYGAGVFAGGKMLDIKSQANNPPNP